MGDVARCSIGKSSDYHNEDLLYKLFGINAELLIDHAWGWEPCTIADVKAYKPSSNSIRSSQVLMSPYIFSKAKLIVREMADLLVLDLVDKGLVTDQLVLTIGYDIENLKDPERRKNYHGPVTKDHYGRRDVPKHANGTVNLGRHTSSAKRILEAVSELFDRIGDNKIIAALYSQHIYCFAGTDHINSVFGDHIKSAIRLEPIEEKILYKSDSIYIGILYQLLKQQMISKGMVEHRKNKYYDPKSASNKSGYIFYDAVEIVLSYIDKKLYLNLLPTVHITGNGGKNLDKSPYQYQINKAISSIYNNQYNENLKRWEKLFRTSGKMLFECEGFKIEFQTPAVSCGGTNRDAEWPCLPAWVYPEPLMCFSEDDPDKAIVNQLKGLVSYGPIDCSYAPVDTMRNSVKLGF